jgi:hypothetical protein
MIPTHTSLNKPSDQAHRRRVPPKSEIICQGEISLYLLLDKYNIKDKENEGSIMSHGKHEGQTFKYVFEHVLSYCKWVVDPNDHGYLLEFKEWLNNKLILLRIMPEYSKLVLKSFGISLDQFTPMIK